MELHEANPVQGAVEEWLSVHAWAKNGVRGAQLGAALWHADRKLLQAGAMANAAASALAEGAGDASNSCLSHQCHAGQHWYHHAA